MEPESEKQFESLQKDYMALKSRYESLKKEFIELQTKYNDTQIPNVRGAGRKPQITEQQRLKIMELRQQGIPFRKIGEQMGISYSSVARIEREELAKVRKRG